MSNSKQNPQFIQVRSPKEYDILNFQSGIIHDKNLTGDAVKLLLIMLDYGKRPNWILRQTHLINTSNMKYKTYSNAIKVLEKSGYIKRWRLNKEKGQFSSYQYMFSQFPTFLDSENTNTEDPVSLQQTADSNLLMGNITSSSNLRLVNKTTNNSEEEERQESLVSSYQKLEDLENTPLSESQKTTIYKKFTHEKILNALKAIKLENANSPFALLWAALQNDYKPNETKEDLSIASIEIVKKADIWLMEKKLNISVCYDTQNAYILFGQGKTEISLIDPNFSEIFCSTLNKMIPKL